jgi:hypothetical protein
VIVSDSHERARRTTLVAYGKAVWSWHPLLVSSPRRLFRPTGIEKLALNPLDDGDNKEFVAEESTV